MTEEIKKIGFGLKPATPDKRDFSHSKVFGKIIMLPTEDFVVAEPLEIKDQRDSDFCVAFSGAAVSEDQEGVKLDPLYLFAKIKEIEGDPNGYGAELRSGCKAAIKFGFLEEKDSIYTIDDERSKIVYSNNWPKELDKKAQIHRKQSYFKADGYKDVFDSLRATMWQNRAEKRSVWVGCIWEEEWTNAPGGIIPKEPGTPVGGHAFKIFGQKKISPIGEGINLCVGGIYLIAQLSNGKDIGDKGIFYFPRETINRVMTSASYTLKDMPPEEAKKLSWSIPLQLSEKVKSFINLIKEFLNNL